MTTDFTHYSYNDLVALKQEIDSEVNRRNREQKAEDWIAVQQSINTYCSRWGDIELVIDDDSYIVSPNCFFAFGKIVL